MEKSTENYLLVVDYLNICFNKWGIWIPIRHFTFHNKIKKD